HKFAKANLPQHKYGNFAERYIAATTSKDTLRVPLRMRFLRAYPQKCAPNCDVLLDADDCILQDRRI
ncbi:MAG: hypothetical protein LBD22_01175, partial [Spirochaetaceae bacterium]|nr:hypothetical protein [Spirochaetaceae bacterium]